MRFFNLVTSLMLILMVFGLCAFAQNRAAMRTFAGVVVTNQFELVPGASIEVEAQGLKILGVSDGEGRFSLSVPNGPLVAKFYGKNLKTVTVSFGPEEKVNDLQIKATYVVSPVNESVTIVADSVAPQADQRNDAVYKNSLFGRDDQVIQTLNAGINAGQHEGGGQSLEIRRFGFNLDHGGVNGGVSL